MAGRARSGKPRLQRAILVLFTICLVLYHVPAVCRARALGGSMQETEIAAGAVMVDDKPVAEVKPKQEENRNEDPETLKRRRSTFKLIYEMLPKGPVAPSGPSPCHNSFPDGSSAEYFPCSVSVSP